MMSCSIKACVGKVTDQIRIANVSNKIYLRVDHETLLVHVVLLRLVSYDKERLCNTFFFVGIKIAHTHARHLSCVLESVYNQPLHSVCLLCNQVI